MLETQEARFLTMNQQQRLEFLGRLAFHVSEVARGSYPEAGIEDKAALTALRAFNEVIQVLSKQLLAAIHAWEAEDAYPDDILFDILIGKAAPGQCRGDLVWAVNASLKDMGFASD